MQETISGIVLTHIPHSDRASILRVYTPTHACMSLVVPAGTTARSRQRAATRLPLAPVEFICKPPAGDALVRPSQLTLRRPLVSLYADPAKNAIGIFLAEFLLKLLRTSPPDAPLFSFIDSSITLLDTLERVHPNFHIAFLCTLTRLLGIAPEVSGYRPEAIFDMRAAGYTTILPGHPDILHGTEARLPRLLSSLTYAGMHHLPLTGTARTALLRGIIAYYGIHLPPLLHLKSLDVLSQLF